MTITRTWRLPKALIKRFDLMMRKLPVPKFGQDSSELEVVLYYCEHKLLKKLKYFPELYTKYENKIEKAKEMLQAIQAKEADLLAEDPKALTCTFYYHRWPSNGPFDVWAGFRLRTRARRFRAKHAGQ
jgi:hypothetical protein